MNDDLILLPDMLYFKDLIKIVVNNDTDGLKAFFEMEGLNVNIADRTGKTALHFAAMYDKVEILEMLINHPKININARDHLQNTPLIVAAEFGNLRSMEVLIQKGAELFRYHSENKNSAIRYAATSDHLECFEALLRTKRSVYIPQSVNATVFPWMYSSGIIEILKKLIIESADDRYYLKTFGNTVLFYGCLAGSLDTIQFIVENYKFDLKRRNYFRLPLHAAICGQSTEVVEYLIRMGASITMGDENGYNAYHYAAMYDRSEKFLEKYQPAEEYLEKILESLIANSRLVTLKAYAWKCAAQKYSNGPAILKRSVEKAIAWKKAESLRILLAYIKDKTLIMKFTKEAADLSSSSFEPLYERLLELERNQVLISELRNNLFLRAMGRSYSSSSMMICNYLLDQGEDPNGILDGLSYLIRACSSEYKNSCVETLLKLGVDVNWLTERKRSALHYAAERGNLENVRLLLEYGADPLVKDVEGYSPLLLSAYRGKADVFFEMFKYDQDLSQRSNSQLTPFLAACSSRNVKIVKALIDAGACLTDVDNANRNCFHLVTAGDVYNGDVRNRSEIIMLLLEKLDKNDFFTMFTATTSKDKSPLNSIQSSYFKNLTTSLIQVFPELLNFIDAPICLKITTNSKQQGICLICRDDFAVDDDITILPCKHDFHLNCYWQWGRQNAICPYCQASICPAKKLKTEQ